MFKYAKTETEKIVRELQDALKVNNEKSEELQKEKDEVNNYISNVECNKFRKKNIITCLIAAVCFVAGGFVNLFPVAIGGVIAIPLVGYSVKKMIKYHGLNKKIKNNRYYEEPMRSLYYKRDLLESKYEKTIDITRELIKELSNNTQILNRIEEYIAASNDPYYIADTKEEYEEMINPHIGDEFQEYLEEKVDYSQVHFDNQIDKSKKYTLSKEILQNKTPML